ncbi:hypothetical protein JCM8097_006033 [Rhodosporidiobolus ruineniae]
MAQKLRPEQAVDQFVTFQSSLQQVKTLVRAGIGCITYLRGLFPDEAFEDYALVAPRPPARKGTKDAEQPKQKSGDQSVRIKQLVRGAMPEVDKLMDYLDKGASEAIEKGYLYQLIFAIYLDPDEPNNLVESYTFTFSYETDSKGNKRPELVVQNQLSGIFLSTSSTLRSDERRKDGEIKRQVQQMIKNLITSTQLLDELPRRRFLNIRLFYTDETPTNYEPPCFKPFELQSSGFTLTTPRYEEQPDFSTLGNMSTGFHGVAIHSVSIAHLLDAAYDENLQLDECLARNKQDADTRSVVWDAEQLASSITDEDAKVVSPEPVGVKDDDGVVVPLEEVKGGEDVEMEVLRKKVGLEYDEKALVLAREEMEETFLDSHLSDNENLRRAITATDPNPVRREGEDPTQLDPLISRQKSYRPPVPFFDETNEQYAQRRESSQPGGAAGVQAAKMVEEETERDVRMASPEAETQLFEYSQPAALADIAETESGPEPDTIKTLTQDDPVVTAPARLPDGAKKKSPNPPFAAGSSRTRPARKAARGRNKLNDTVCECGDKDEDGGMIMCTSCNTWKHLVCYGYASDTKGAALPSVFVCYRCRTEAAKGDSLLDQGREDEIDEALAGLKSLALVRRALDGIWDSKELLDSKTLAKKLSVDNSTAAQVLRRLEKEEFIYEQTAVSRRAKGNSQLNSLKKGPLAVDKTPPKRRKKQAEYFTPGGGAEFPFSSKLEVIDADAEGEDEEVTNKGPLPQASKPPPVSTARQAAVLVEATPSPAYLQQQQHLPPTEESDDPILDPNSQPVVVGGFDAYSTPREQDTIQDSVGGGKSGGSSGPRAPPANPGKKDMLEAPRAPGRAEKGKGKAVESYDEILDASAMVVDEDPSSQLAMLAAGSTSSKRRRAAADSSSSSFPSETNGAKRRKCSEAEQHVEC